MSLRKAARQWAYIIRQSPKHNVPGTRALNREGVCNKIGRRYEVVNGIYRRVL